MAQSDSDRNLLVGVLALQLSLVSEHQLLAAVKAWAFDKSRLIEDLFFEQGAIDEQSRRLLNGLVDRNQPQKDKDSSVEKSESRGLRESFATVMVAVQKLSNIDDEELRGSVVEFLEGTISSGGQTIDFGATQPLQDGTHGRRFRFLRPLANGGLGRVSVAEDLELHREVALKQILPRYLANPESRARFLVEAEVTGRLEHPGIVPVYSLGSSDADGPFYAMQFIRGVSLAEAIEKLHLNLKKLDGHAVRLELRKLILRLIDACQAVQYAHSKGVLHRDIKPKNIMLGKFGETFVVDWGLARVGKGDSSLREFETDESVLIPSGSGSAATRLGSMIGTLEYMSPEQADGRLNELGPASDVFSLGATLYCILTGSPPTSGKNTKERHRLEYGQFLKPSQINREVPRALDAICMKALEVDIANRYRTVAGLMEDLEAWSADEPVNAYAESLADRTRRWLKEHRALTATLAGVLVTSTLALSIFLVWASYTNSVLAKARDDATANQRLARKMLLNELRLDDELLSKNELSAKEIASLRLRLAEGVYDTYEKWYQSNPGDPELSSEFAFMARVMSNLKRSVADFATASVYIQTSLVAQESKPYLEMSPAEKIDYVSTLNAASQLDMLEGRLGRALTLIDMALLVLESIDPPQLRQAEVAQKSIEVQFQRANVLFELGRYSESHDELKQGLAAIGGLLTNSTPVGTSVPALDALKMNMMLLRVQTLAESGSLEEAMQKADEAIEFARPFANARKREFLYALITSLNLSARVRIDKNQELERATELLKEAETLVRAESPKLNSVTMNASLSVTQRLMAMLLCRQDNLQEALRSAEESYSVAQKLAASLPLPQNCLLEAEAALEKSLIYLALGDTANAEKWLGVSRGCLKKGELRAPESARIKAMSAKVQ